MYDAPTPRQAKEIATKLKSEVHVDYMASWTKISVNHGEGTNVKVELLLQVSPGTDVYREYGDG